LTSSALLAAARPGVDPRLVGEAYLTQTSRRPDDAHTGAPVTAAPLFTTTIALTKTCGRPRTGWSMLCWAHSRGGPAAFASRMVYVCEHRRIPPGLRAGFQMVRPARRQPFPTPRRSRRPSVPVTPLRMPSAESFRPSGCHHVAGLPAPVPGAPVRSWAGVFADRKADGSDSDGRGGKHRLSRIGGKLRKVRGRRRWPTTRPSALPASSRTWLAPPCNGFYVDRRPFLHGVHGLSAGVLRHSQGLLVSTR